MDLTKMQRLPLGVETHPQVMTALSNIVERVLVASVLYQNQPEMLVDTISELLVAVVVLGYNLALEYEGE